MTTNQECCNRYLSGVFGREGYRPALRILAEMGRLQNIHTPYELCKDILDKLSEFVNLKKVSIAVLFNLEFIEMLESEYGVPAENITFICDSDMKVATAKNWYNIKTIHNVVYGQALGVDIVPKIKKQFDVVIMNPPYQGDHEGEGEGRGG